MKRLKEKIFFVVILLFDILLFILFSIFLYYMIKNFRITICYYICTVIFGSVNLSILRVIYICFKENYYYCPKCKRMRWIQMRGYSMYCDKCGHYIGEAETPIKDVYDEDAMP